MIQNISIRVPWHDNKWNGNICRDPKRNTACLRLSAISDNRDVEFECKNCGKCIKGKEANIHCIRENVAFMSKEKLIQKIEHPYKIRGNKQYQHMEPTDIEIPPYSFVARCFSWLMVGNEYKNVKELNKLYGVEFDEEIEPTLGFTSDWAQNAINQKAIMNEFYKNIFPNRSLVIAYAKQVPFIEDIRRVVVGIGKVTNIIPAKEYNVKKDSENEYRGMTFETIVSHSIREEGQEGFLIPYDELIAYANEHKDFNIADYTILAPNEAFYEFSFTTQHVSFDTTISVLLQCKTVLKKISQLLNKDYSKQIKWLKEQIEFMYSERGVFSGLPNMLNAIGIEKGILVGKDAFDKSIENNSDIFDEVKNVLENAKTSKNKVIATSIDKVCVKTYNEILCDENKFKLLKLLSRFDITKKQAEYIWNNCNKDIGTNIKGIEIISNPYVLYEKTRLEPVNYISLKDMSQISIHTIDFSMFLNEGLIDKYELDDYQKMDGFRDERRIRAIVISILEKELEKGNTILYEDEMLSKIGEYFNEIEQDVVINSEILNTYIEFFSSEILQRLDKAGNKYYKLKRINEYDYVIESEINNRLISSNNLISIDWEEEYKINDEIQANIKKINNKQKVEAIKLESINALNILTAKKISVLTGGAGVGKTTLLNLFCQCEKINQEGILVLAPTGKATVNIKSKLNFNNANIEAYNVAQFLSKHNRFDHKTQRYLLKSENVTISAKTVIIDESSMLTTEMIASLLQIVKNTNRIIFAGDPNQIPPIGSGKPFVDLINLLKKKESDNNKYIAILEISKRQDLYGNDSNRLDILLSNAFANKGLKQDLFYDILNRKDSHIKFIKYTDSENLEKQLWDNIIQITGMNTIDDTINFDKSLGAQNCRYSNHYGYGDVKGIENWQILIPEKNSTTGTRYFNLLLHNHMRDENIKYYKNNKSLWKLFGADCFTLNDKIINTQNGEEEYWDYKERCVKKGYVANGEIGVISFNQLDKKPKCLKVEYASQIGSIYSYERDSFASDNNDGYIEFAYALTIHKAQGSQYSTTILIINEPSGLLNRELLYTALTRQKENIIVFYNNEPYKILEYANEVYSEVIARKTDLFADKLIRNRPDYILKKGKYLDVNLINVTSNNELVRSKSELIIADKLKNAGITYHYEEELIIDGVLKLPDFTIEHNGKTYYWEHLGMLDNDNYKQSWENKKKFYEKNNIVEDINLIITQDVNGGINSNDIDSKIEWLLNQ